MKLLIYAPYDILFLKLPQIFITKTLKLQFFYKLQEDIQNIHIHISMHFGAEWNDSMLLKSNNIAVCVWYCIIK